MLNNMEENINILGVRIDNFSVGETEERISEIQKNSPAQKFVVTLNPEILLKAHRDEDYKNILNRADLNICDGFGIKFVSFFRRNKLKSRFAGADLAEFILDGASRRGQNVLIVAAKNSLSSPEEIEQSIRQKYPGLSVKSEYFLAGQNFFDNGIIKKAEVVFVNFGAPEQEKFIFENRAKFPNAKILMGAGGTFDFITGKIRRAPRIFRSLGLEWLWRLTQQPKRFRRIINAILVFPIKALIYSCPEPGSGQDKV